MSNTRQSYFRKGSLKSKKITKSIKKKTIVVRPRSGKTTPTIKRVNKFVKAIPRKTFVARSSSTDIA
jgi:hypothetical protein